MRKSIMLSMLAKMGTGCHLQFGAAGFAAVASMKAGHHASRPYVADRIIDQWATTNPKASREHR
jgi:hypothetical protein